MLQQALRREFGHLYPQARLMMRSPLPPSPATMASAVRDAAPVQSHVAQSATAPNARYDASPVSAESLDALGVHFGTDLSSFGRDCLRRWQPLLAHLRHAPFDLLEVGVGDGASLRLWRAWFPHARLVGLDVRRVALDPPLANCTLVHGRQSDPAVLKPLIQRYRFRLIIDDGSPRSAEKIDTFLALFPWMPPASLYLLPGPSLAALPIANGAIPPGEVDACGAPDPAWFGNLGVAVARRAASAQAAGLLSPLDQATALASGVHLFPGSVAVTT